MNVIISNKYQTLLATLDIDVIKSINGEFEVADIVNQFTNFYYNKMILDITALKNYQDVTTLQNLSVSMDVSNIILLLDDSEVVNSPKYLSSLISMGIYNFSRNVDAIKFLINNPNSYKDVAQYHQLNTGGVGSGEEGNGDYNKLNLRVIGIKNVTNHAGSTTFTYLMKKHLEGNYNVIAVEADERDFLYLNDNTLKSTTSLDLPAFIATNSGADVILVDLNDKGSVSSCTEVIYLIEPGLIKLNKLIRRDKKIFEKLKDEKIVLNRSVLNGRDVKDFEYESKSNIYFNMPYLDDKIEHHEEIDNFLIKLGFSKLENTTDNKNNGLFSIFK